MSQRALRWLIALGLGGGLASTTVRADPEGYRRGERGLAPGKTYVPVYGGITISVRGVEIEAVKDGERWECGAPPRETVKEELVTVVLKITNLTNEPLSTQTLPVLDLVDFEQDEPHVEGGPCMRTGESAAEVTIGGKKPRLVRRQFLIPRGRAPKILVYNDDDFPALFELPKPTRRPAKGRVR